MVSGFSRAGLLAAAVIWGVLPSMLEAAQPPRPVEIVAHRGASHDAPENTLAAFRLGWQQLADADELDVQLTRDGRLIVIHDLTAKRTAGVDRPVAQMTFDDLRQLDAGSWKGPQWKGERLPALDEVLATVPEGRRLFVEIKGSPEAVPEVERIVRAAGTPPQRIAIIGFTYETVKLAKARMPQLKVYWIASAKTKDRQPPPAVDTLIARAKAAGLDGLDLHFEFPIDREFVAQVHAAGLELHVWTVDDPAVARRLAAAGVNGITTNRPGWLRQQLHSAE